MEPIAEQPVAVETAGEERIIASLLPDVPVDAEGTGTDQGFLLDNRLRATLDLRAQGWSLGTEWDLFTGPVLGDPWGLPVEIDERHREDTNPLDAESFRARRAALEGRIGPVAVAAGLMTSHWGLGMVANGGAQDPTFGRTDFGDRVLRLRLATRPLGKEVPWTVALMGDRVVADDTARLLDGQVAWQGVLATLYGTPEGPGRGGLYGVYRDQTEPSGDRTRVGMVDLYGEGELALGAGLSLSGGLEAAAITGFTGRSRTVNAVDGLQVRSAGLTGYLGLDALDDRLGLKVRAGWASGDGDPDDDTTHDFSFDRDHDVGMVLFDEVIAAINAQSYALLSDLEHTGAPPDGVEALVDEGAFKRAAFAQPVLELRPRSWLTLRAGATLAWSTAPVAHPYYTYRAGGTPTNQLDQPTEGNALGTELDWALSVRSSEQGERAVLRPSLTLQGGHLLPSPNLGLEQTTSLLMASVHVPLFRLRYARW